MQNSAILPTLVFCAKFLDGHPEGTAVSGSGVSYTAFAVPEPTSGLLMLVGLAGLALRRRRA